MIHFRWIISRWTYCLASQCWQFAGSLSFDLCRHLHSTAWLPSLHGNRARIPRDLGGSCHFYDLTLQVAHHIYSILLTTYNHLASLWKRNMEGCEYEEVRAVGDCRRLALLFSSLFPTTLKSGMWTIADYQCVKFVDLSQVQNYKNTV